MNCGGPSSFSNENVRNITTREVRAAPVGSGCKFNATKLQAGTFVCSDQNAESRIP